jgi:hypothetical protein
MSDDRFLSSLISHPRASEDGTDTVFRNVGYQTPYAGEQPKRLHITRLYIQVVWDVTPCRVVSDVSEDRSTSIFSVFQLKSKGEVCGCNGDVWGRRGIAVLTQS